MPQFTYAAVDPSGKTFRGELVEADQWRALERIKAMGLYPTQVRVQRGPSAKVDHRTVPKAEQHGHALPWWRRRSISRRALADFTRELATLVESGIPLVRGLQAITRQEKNLALVGVLRQMIGDIEGGLQFSEALSKQPRIFNPLYINLCVAGEQGGALDAALNRLADLLERTEQLKAKVTAAMFYPAAVLLVAAGIIVLLMVAIVPQFQQVFTDMSGGQSLPEFTLFVLGISQALRTHGVLLAAAVLLLPVFYSWAVRFQSVRRWIDQFKLTVPIFGKLYHLVALTRFCRTLGTLLQNGVPVLQCLTIVRESAGNCIVAQAIDRIHAAIQEGEAFTPIMDGIPLFPATLVSMVDVGEQTGTLPSMLGKAAEKYDARVDHAVTGLTALIEPIMIIILAVIVGSIVIAMFLPLIRLMQTGFDDHGGVDPSA